jgi:hypothetical protein
LANYLNYHGAPLIKVFRFVDFGNGMTTPSGPLSTYNGWNNNDFVGTILCHAVVDMGFQPVEGLRRVFYSRGDPTPIRVVGDKPYNAPYSGSRDWQRYGSSFDALFSAGRALAGGSVLQQFDLGREHNVRHPNLHGDFRVKVSASDLVGHTGDIVSKVINTGHASHTFPVPVFHGVSGKVGRDLIATNTPSGWEYSASTLATLPGSDPWLCELRVLLEHIRTVLIPTDGMHVVLTHTGSPTYTWSFITNDLVWTEEDDAIRLSYKVFWDCFSSNPDYSGHIYYQVDMVISTVVGLQPPTGYESAGLHGPLSPGVMYGTIEKTIYDGTPHLVTVWNGGETHRVWDLSQTGFCYYLSNPGHEAYTGSEHPLDKLRRVRPWSQHAKSVDKYASDIRGSAFISTADALSSGIGSLNQDLWQTLVKLPTIASQMDVFLDAARVVKSLAPSVVEFSPETLKDVLDVATALRLTQTFEIRPEVDLVYSLAPQMIDVIRNIDRVSRQPQGDVVFRGVFKYTFSPGTFGYPSSKLTTRTRVVVDSSGFNRMKGVLTLDTLGFAPFTSTFWDLRPFTFVVNWFTGVGSRIRDIENVALVGAIGIRCFTHSYLIESSVSDSQVEAYSLDQASLPGSEKLSWWYYVREVSTHLPPPRQGAFDFRFPTHLPDWATAGSLVWQVFLK